MCKTSARDHTHRNTIVTIVVKFQMRIDCGTFSGETSQFKEAVGIRIAAVQLIIWIWP